MSELSTVADAWIARLEAALKAEREEVEAIRELLTESIANTAHWQDKYDAAEAKLEAVRGLPERWLDDCMNYRCTSKCSNKKCADELLEALLEQTK